MTVAMQTTFRNYYIPTGPFENLTEEQFAEYVELCKAGDSASVAQATAMVGPRARADAEEIREMLKLIKVEPTEEMREELHTEIKRNETRLLELREKISLLQGAKFRLESQLSKLKNSPAIQNSSPVHGHSLSMRLNNQVLKAAVSDELRTAGLIT
jgi:hypothetical protein